MKTPPGVYRHWKGTEYRVLFVAWDASNTQAVISPRRVVYMAMRTGVLYTRDETEFHELVRRTPPDPNAPCLCDARGQGECREHPGDQTMVPRFALIREDG